MGFLKKILLSVLTLTPFVTSAHEAYVLDQKEFWSGISQPFSLKAFDALLDSHNLHLTIIIVGSILTLMLINFIVRSTYFGDRISKGVEKLSFLGPIIVRLTIATSFFFSAYTWSFLGPELTLQSMPYAVLIRWALFVVSVLIALGLFTRWAAIVSLVIFTLGYFIYGSYLNTYLNYLGEIIVLALFGMRVWSVDRFLFGPLKRFKKYEKYETTIVRLFYGAALIFAGVTVKFLHPDLTLEVVNNWHLTQFSWLFPSDPMLVVMGAGLAEIAIGILIMIGFEMRLAVVISLFYITLSLLYFRELVWPHLMLYGISLNLIVQPEVLTLDHLIFKKHRQYMKWWRRLFQPHNHSGKSDV